MGVDQRVLKLILLAVSTALDPEFTQADNGYVGVFADPLGTEVCAQVPPGTAKILYVIAKVAGSTSEGISGSEFRIDVSNPTGWYFSYSPPAVPTTVLGNPLDLDPAPNSGGGTTLGFASCQVPSGGNVPLGTLSVFNVSGQPTNLSVKRHSQPNSAAYFCPLFVICDQPVYSQVCMSANTSAATCSTISTAKPVARQSSDESVFSIDLENSEISLQPPPGDPFAEREVNLGNSTLWVAGIRVDTPVVAIRLEEGRLYFGSSYVDFTTGADTPPFDESDYARVYATVPRAIELTSSGLTWSAAATVHTAELQSLVATAIDQYAMNGTAAALDVFLQSALIEEAHIREGVRISYRPRGLRVSTVFRLESEPLTGELESISSRATRIANAVAQSLDGGGRGLLILVSRSGNIRVLGGRLRTEAESQLLHLVSGGSVEGMPPGPLKPGSFVVTEFFAQKGRR